VGTSTADLYVAHEVLGSRLSALGSRRLSTLLLTPPYPHPRAPLSQATWRRWLFACPLGGRSAPINHFPGAARKLNLLREDDVRGRESSHRRGTATARLIRAAAIGLTRAGLIMRNYRVGLFDECATASFILSDNGRSLISIGPYALLQLNIYLSRHGLMGRRRRFFAPTCLIASAPPPPITPPSHQELRRSSFLCIVV
jgi:hypothetical protein